MVIIINALLRKGNLTFFVLSVTKMIVVLEAHCNMCPDVMITSNGNVGFRKFCQQ